MNVNFHPDNCKHYQFFHDWLIQNNSKQLAVHNLQMRFNATARNRLKYAIKNDYRVHRGWDIRNNHLDDVYQVNISKGERQGRKMGEGYFNYPEKIIFKIPQCDKHYVEFFGCLTDQGTLVGYIEAYFIGEMVEISRILGHAEHMKNGVMLLLMDDLIDYSKSINARCIVYYLWDSGTLGLQYWKHSTGFRPIYLQEGVEKI